MLMHYLLALSGNQIEIPPGTHTYSFACALPAMLPTSFEGTYGHVRYTVRVILERPWKFDQSYKVAFTVLKEFDLNYDSPILRVQEIHIFHCLQCTNSISFRFLLKWKSPTDSGVGYAPPVLYQ